MPAASRSGDGRLNRDRVAADGGPQGVGRIERHQLALIENGDAIGLVGFFQQVRRQHDRHAFAAAQLAQVIPQIAAGRRVQARAGLVEQQQPRAVQHSFGQFDATPQAAGKRFDPVAHADRRARIARAAHRLRVLQRFAAQAIEMPLVHQIFADRELAIEAGGLKHNADAGADIGNLPAQIEPQTRSPRRVPAATASRAGGTASTCRRRWGRGTRKSRPAEPRTTLPPEPAAGHTSG